MEEATHGQLFEAALGGDLAAWNELVDRLAPAIWSAARSFRLDRAQSEDVFQTVWLRLWDRRDTIENPEALPGWIRTTARNEARNMLRAAGRIVLVDTSEPSPPTSELGSQIGPADIAEQQVLNEVLWQAFRRLDERCQQLLRMLALKTPLKEVAAATGMPVGSIGPTRGRCLEKLRRTPEIARLGEVPL